MDTPILALAGERGQSTDGWEIERKFLVETFPAAAARYTPSLIRQGYAAVDASGSSVRVRQIEGRFS